jgi:hypothetical protein
MAYYLQLFTTVITIAQLGILFVGNIAGFLCNRNEVKVGNTAYFRLCVVYLFVVQLERSFALFNLEMASDYHDALYGPIKEIARET